MRSRLVRPETVKLPLSDSDWVVIKKRLNQGEKRAHLSRMFRNAREVSDGTLRLDPGEVGISKALAYVIDWSFCDDAGERIDIRDKTEDIVTGAFDAIEPESFDEIVDAIDAHLVAMKRERDASKKTPDGENALSATSSSLSVVAGDQVGSVN